MQKGTVSRTVCLLFVASMSLLPSIQLVRSGMTQNSFQVVSSWNDPEDFSVTPYLDILNISVETDGFALLRFNMTLRGSLPDSHLFVNKTVDDGLSYAWWIDADRNSATGQRHQYVGSEYNLMFQASGASPTGEWGARVDITAPGYSGGGSVQFTIKDNKISLLVGLSQIGSFDRSIDFDWSATTWGRLDGSSLGSNPETVKQTANAQGTQESVDRSILLLVNGNLYGTIKTSLSTFEQDLIDEGYRVVNATVSEQTSPPEIRDLIKSFYVSTGNLVGVILIGNIKAAYLEIFTGSTDPQTHEVSVYKSLDACDMYYMDLDGKWEHVVNPDFDEDKPPYIAHCYKFPSCDTFRNEYIVYLDQEAEEWNYSQIENKTQFKAEIWVSRIMAHNIKIPGKNEAEIISDYFERDHNFRIGVNSVSSKGYMLAAWQESGTGAYQGMNFSTVFETIIKADNVTKSSYLTCLGDSKGSKLLFLGAHSAPQMHGLYDQSVTTDDLILENKTSLFYILNACSSCRWDQYISFPTNPNYLGGLYVFDTSPSRKNNGLGAIGFTGVGGFNWLNYLAGYLRANRDASYGDAYKYWFNSMLVDFMCCWPPGALNYVFLGDPTIGPRHPIVKIHADLNGDGRVNIQDITIVAVAYGSKPEDQKWNEMADLDKNGQINIIDVTMVAKDYGRTV